MASVLGGTIGELQSRMSMREVNVWLAYRDKYGPMNDVRRYDRPAAILASILSHAHGGKSPPRDFMPFGQEEKETTVEDIITAFGGVEIGQRR
mgnify:CR=1 FL=1